MELRFKDNSATTPCTLIGKLDRVFYDATKSEWSSSSFFIQQIQDLNNPATTFTFTVTGLGARCGIISRFQVNLTEPGEFVAPPYDLQIVLNASKSFGYTTSPWPWVKIYA
jgi:hypothetical protein